MEQPRAAVRCLHASRVRLPLALARVHRTLAPGETVELCVNCTDGGGIPAPVAPDDAGDGSLAAVLAGAGFDVERVEMEGGTLRAFATRARTLPDIVAPGMRLLVCGLNPSVFSADRGVGYARPGNRFWPAALDAGLVRRDRDALHALTASGVGMTDLVKRATTSAAELTSDEYRLGLARVEGLVRWLQPGVVCFVGLAGWRAGVDPKAVPGPQPAQFGGRPAYVMPSTSGLNAHASRADLAAHLGAAARLTQRGMVDAR